MARVLADITNVLAHPQGPCIKQVQAAVCSEEQTDGTTTGRDLLQQALKRQQVGIPLPLLDPYLHT